MFDDFYYAGDDNMNFPDYECLEYCSSEDTDWDSAWMYYNEEDYSVWKTKTGNGIAIKDMTTSHIKNCIKLIVKRDGWREEYLPNLVKELINRNEL